MKSSSAKNKGRRCKLETKDLLLKYAPTLQPDDIFLPTGSVGGEDIVFSPNGRAIYPFAIECKLVESLNIHQAYAQAAANANPAHIPIVFFRRNRTPLMVCLTAEDFMKLTRGNS